jgi:hypothetical protein
MDAFTLELIRPGGDPVQVKTIKVSSASDIWGYVECAARRLSEPEGTRIRVRDSNGGVVVLTGARTALLVARDREENEE